MASFVLGLKQSAGAGMRSLCSSGRARMISNESKLMCPWLMLPPDCEGVYKLYKLAEDRIERGVKLAPADGAVLVGSSHGWLAFFNDRTNRVFLSNPLSGRQIKLPPIHSLPNPEINLRAVPSVVCFSRISRRETHQTSPMGGLTRISCIAADARSSAASPNSLLILMNGFLILQLKLRTGILGTLPLQDQGLVTG